MVNRDGGHDWVLGTPSARLAAAYVRHAMFLLKRGGHAAFLLPVTFLSGNATLFDRHPPRFVHVLEEKALGSSMALFVWQNTSTPNRTSVDFVSWTDESRLLVDRRRILRLDWRTTIPSED